MQTNGIARCGRGPAAHLEVDELETIRKRGRLLTGALVEVVAARQRRRRGLLRGTPGPRVGRRVRVFAPSEKQGGTGHQDGQSHCAEMSIFRMVSPICRL